jgi:predicted phosphodiesterase
MSLTPTEPLLILSDLHLGHKASKITNPEQLSPLLNIAKTTIFNGDTAEMRNTTDRPVGRKLAADLARVCHHCGTKSIFINGNHDPTISELNHLDLAGGRILVTHGDILFLGVAPWSREAKRYLSAHLEILNGLPKDALKDFEQLLLATKRASLQLQMLEKPASTGKMNIIHLIARQAWPPYRPLLILRAWIQMPSLARKLAESYRPEADFLIVGHTHFPGVWKNQSRGVINTGTFIQHFQSKAVLIENRGLEICRIKEVKKQFVLGKVEHRYRLKSRVQKVLSPES